MRLAGRGGADVFGPVDPWKLSQSCTDESSGAALETTQAHESFTPLQFFSTRQSLTGFSPCPR